VPQSRGGLIPPGSRSGVGRAAYPLLQAFTVGMTGGRHAAFSRLLVPVTGLGPVDRSPPSVVMKQGQTEGCQRIAVFGRLFKEGGVGRSIVALRQQRLSLPQGLAIIARPHAVRQHEPEGQHENTGLQPVNCTHLHGFRLIQHWSARL